MNRITDVTRQDIIDIIRDGIWISLEEPEYDRESGQVVDGIHLRVTPHRISGPKADRACTKKAFGLETRRSIRKFTTTIQGTGGQTVR